MVLVFSCRSFHHLPAYAELINHARAFSFNGSLKSPNPVGKASLKPRSWPGEKERSPVLYGADTPLRDTPPRKPPCPEVLRPDRPTASRLTVLSCRGASGSRRQCHEL